MYYDFMGEFKYGGDLIMLTCFMFILSNSIRHEVLDLSHVCRYD